MSTKHNHWGERTSFLFYQRRCSTEKRKSSAHQAVRSRERAGTQTFLRLCWSHVAAAPSLLLGAMQITVNYACAAATPKRETKSNRYQWVRRGHNTHLLPPSRRSSALHMFDQNPLHMFDLNPPSHVFQQYADQLGHQRFPIFSETPMCSTLVRVPPHAVTERRHTSSSLRCSSYGRKDPHSSKSNNGKARRGETYPSKPLAATTTTGSCVEPLTLKINSPSLSQPGRPCCRCRRRCRCHPHSRLFCSGAPSRRNWADKPGPGKPGRPAPVRPTHDSAGART